MPRDDIEKEPRPAFDQPANVNTRKPRSDTRKAPRPSSRETSTTRNARDLLSLSEARVIHQSTDAEPRYHGPTSTLFEDTVGDRRVHHSIPIAPRLPSAWVQKGLMAEAACQRMYFLSHNNCVSRESNYDLNNTKQDTWKQSTTLKRNSTLTALIQT